MKQTLIYLPRIICVTIRVLDLDIIITDVVFLITFPSYMTLYLT